MASTPSETVAARFEEFCTQPSVKRALETLADSYPQERSFELDLDALARFDPDLADELVENPDSYLASCQQAIAHSGFHTISGVDFKPNVRPINVPDSRRVMVLDLGAAELDKLVGIEGVLSSITEIKPRLVRAVWKCPHCDATTITSPDKTSPVNAPSSCQQCGRGGLKLDERASTFVNMQRAQMQDPVEKMRGNIPAVHAELWMEDDLTNTVAPGDKVMVSGVLRLKPVVQGKNKSSVYSKYFDICAIHKVEMDFEEIEISREEEQQILQLKEDPQLFQKIVGSIAPSIYGYSELKSAIALQLFGGTPGKILPDGERIRSDIHVLLIGDPGCLVGDERIVAGNGAILKMENAGHFHLQEINLQVLTGEGGKKRDWATVFHRYKNQPVIEVITESGKSVKGTLNHPLEVVEGLQRSWKRLDELKVGDRLASVTSIPCTITKPIPTGFVPLKRTLGPRFKGKLPKLLTPELAGLLGYVLGDGWVRGKEVGFLVAEPEKDILPDLLKRCRKLFGIVAHPVSRHLLPGRKVKLYYYTLNSKDLASNLLSLREKRVPDLVLQSGNKVAAEFLRWLFEADGTVFDKGRGRRAVGLKAKNIELLRDVQMLLLRFHVHSRIVGNALLIRRGNDIKRFSKSVGFVSAKKNGKLAGLVRHAQDFSRVKDQRIERIVKVIRHPVQTVYDIEVPSSHRFIANGIMSHNTGKSTILEYVRHIAPKCVVVSGGSSSGVGITAAAERDELTEGWILKAGAMVLANGGLVAIDEVDKMKEEDRGAMHQAMEQQRISVAKAGIVTEFQSRTSVLAAANPKHGRFDLNTPIPTQFALSAPLISRFDLIFAIRDVLDESKDRKMASHILEGHMVAKRAGQSAAVAPLKSAGPKEAAKFESINPAIDSPVLRKYIAYARRNVFPEMTLEAAQKIEAYYVELRRLGKDQNTFAVTARQIEAIIRLSQAAAKLRMSPLVELADAQTAIDLTDFMVHEIYIDRETGRLDSDVVNIGQSKSRQDRVRSVLSLITSMEKQVDLVSIDEMVKQCADYGIDEQAARKLVDELKRQGDLYEPKPGFIKTARPRE
jgi:replicative DNA helicase Mcm